MPVKKIFSSKIRLKAVIKIMLFFAVLISVLWYKAPVSGLNIKLSEVSKIVVFNMNASNELTITNENYIKYIVDSLNSVYLVRDMPFRKKDWGGLKMTIYGQDLNDGSGINDFEIYSPIMIRIGRFNYIDRNEILPYDYINYLCTNAY